jgi:hypothetical protein
MSDVEHPIIEITVRGAQGAGKSTIAAAIREMLAEADIAAAVVSNEEPTHTDKVIERLHDLRGRRPRVLIKTQQSGDDFSEHSTELERAVWAAEFVRVRALSKELRHSYAGDPERLRSAAAVASDYASAAVNDFREELIGDPVDHRRDIEIADAVLATLKNSDIGEMRAITMTKAIMAAIERVERSQR